MRAIDMHVHTTASIGLLTAEQLFSYVRSSDVQLFSATDLDCPQTLTVPRDIAERYAPGFEVETEMDGRIVPLLVYGDVRPNSPFGEQLQKQRSRRLQHVRRIVSKLRKQRMPISLPEVVYEAGPECKCITPLHIARTLVRRGLAGSLINAVKKYLAVDNSFHSTFLRLPAWQVIEMAHTCNAIVIAPCSSAQSSPTHVRRLRRIGIDGFQTRSPMLTAAQSENLERFARCHGLLVSGGYGTAVFTADSNRIPVRMHDGYVEDLRLALNGARSLSGMIR